MIKNKPKNWITKSFSEKLKFYAYKRDLNKIKSEFCDKYSVKDLIKYMAIPNLYYANEVKYIISQSPNKFDYYFIIPFEYEFNLNYKFDTINYFVEKGLTECNTGNFVEFMKEKYDIHMVKKKDIRKTKIPYEKNYIVKVNIGWNTFIIVLNNKVKIIKTKSIYFKHNQYKEWFEQVQSNYNKNVFKEFKPLKIFTEELLGCNLKVFEFFCIHGQPILLSHYYETSSKKYENNFYINLEKEEIEFLPIKNIIGPNSIYNPYFVLDEKACKDMINICLEMCHMFEFVRIDFYYIGKKIYFSEYTFKPYNLKLNKYDWGDIGKYLSKKWI